MKVKTTRCFYDLKDDTYRKEGDIFEVNKDRFDELNSKVPGFVEEVKEVKKEEKQEEKKKASKK